VAAPVLEMAYPPGPSPAEASGDRTFFDGQIGEHDLRQILLGYLEEGRAGRNSGTNPRDDVWRNNVEQFWSRYDFADKAPWQAREVMPQVQNSCERFSSTLRSALKAAGEFYEPKDPSDPNGTLTPIIRKVLDFYLDRCGKNSSGHNVGFDHVFGQIMLGGTLKANCASVTWDHKRRMLSIEAVDPSEVWLDPTGRNLYRIRERKQDFHQLRKLKALKDSKGKPIYHAPALERLRFLGGSRASTDDIAHDKDRMSGGAHEISSARRPVRLHEFVCDIVNADGELLAENQLVTMANETEIIRGPEPNPFWHKKDWVVFAPMLDLPWTVYGKTYVESFAQLASTFTELTNLLLDGIRTTTMKAFMVYPEALQDPTQLNDGVSPNKVFIGNSEDWDPSKPFIQEVDLGSLSRESFVMWEGIKNQLMEAASENEIALGQLAPKSGTTAFEIGKADEGSNSIMSNIATDVESTTISPILELAWMTILQHMDPDADPELAALLGPDWSQVFKLRRKELRDANFQIHVSGITGLMKRGQVARALLGALNVIGSNQLLVQAFQQQHSLPKVIAQILRGAGIDPSTLKPDPGEQPIMLPQQGAPATDLADTDPAAPGPIPVAA